MNSYTFLLWLNYYHLCSVQPQFQRTKNFTINFFSQTRFKISESSFKELFLFSWTGLAEPANVWVINPGSQSALQFSHPECETPCSIDLPFFTAYSAKIPFSAAVHWEAFLEIEISTNSSSKGCTKVQLCWSSCAETLQKRLYSIK